MLVFGFIGDSLGVPQLCQLAEVLGKLSLISFGNKSWTELSPILQWTLVNPAKPGKSEVQNQLINN